jgi:16S rRNA (guanine966-N2)-methyltransferase
MRVIAGTAKRLLLKTPRGNETRPTSDKIKETLFNMIAPDLYEARFLDLFAGSGGIGIEALSRGVKEAVFIEQSREACKCIRENLEHTRFEDKSKLIAGDVRRGLFSASAKEPFDIIFMDPPYDKGLEEGVLAYLATSTLISEASIIIVEASKETKFDYLATMGYIITREKIYKTSKHVFITKGDNQCKI